MVGIKRRLSCRIGCKAIRSCLPPSPVLWLRKPQLLFGVLMATSLSLPPPQFLLFPRRSPPPPPPPPPPIPHPHLVSPPRKSTTLCCSSSTPSADASYPVVTEETAEEDDHSSSVLLPREGSSPYEAVGGTEDPLFRYPIRFKAQLYELLL
ncbi:hypothetical protein BHM03_00037904 [Ensete ventricosum]|nr:hypothetical protein BHM03_00037904 [Ensete ventricosum]